MNTILFQKTYLLYNELSTIVPKFPKISRYSLSIKIESSCLALIEQIIRAELSEPVFKEKALFEAGAQFSLLKMLIRICVEKKLIKENKYFTWSNQLIEIVKMISGWRKTLRR